MNQQNCEQEQCVWSTGKEFIESDKGMCLPAVLTASYPDFSGCSQRNTSDKCDGQCQWYDAGFTTCATALGTRPVACPTATWNLERCQYDCPHEIPDFHEVPTYVPMTCTHKDGESSIEAKVSLCRNP
jgi:hypothetical protein